MQSEASKRVFLMRYYISNLIGSRFVGALNLAGIGRWRGEWSKIKNTLSGRDTWLVVGNGPSLRAEDLSALQGIPSIASNKVGLIYPQTTWRPALYTIADPLVAFKLDREFYGDQQVICPHSVCGMIRAENRLPFRLIEIDDARAMHRRAPFRPDPMSGFYDGRTVTVHNLQIAMWLGAKRILLIGCDHFYNERTSSDVTKLSHEGQNHFHPDYRKPGEIVNNAPIAAMNAAYDFTREVAEAQGVQIVNITRTTALESFERAEIDEVIATLNAPRKQRVGAI